MRRLLPVLALLAVAAHHAAAQMPSSIKKPIEAARKSVNATNAQTSATERAGSAPATAPAMAQSAAPAQAKAAPPAAGKRVAPQSAGRVTVPAAPAQDSTKVTFEREVFTYDSGERRDPFASPFETGEIRPLIADLHVVGIIFDASGRNSVAVMRDVSTQIQYRVKVGQMLGRAKVSQIRPQEVVMTIEEYGFRRQELLKLSLPQTKRTP